MYKFDPTTPAGRLLLSVDFSRLLPAGVTIAQGAVTIDVHALSEASDSTPSSRLDGPPILSGDQKTISQWFKDGVEEVDYVLTYLATFSNGEKEPVEVAMPIRRYI